VRHDFGAQMWGRARPRAAVTAVQMALMLAALHLPSLGHAAPPAAEQTVVLDGLPQVSRPCNGRIPHLPVTGCETVNF